MRVHIAGEIHVLLAAAALALAAPALAQAPIESSSEIRFQLDLRADEPQEQAKEPDTEEAEQSDDHEDDKGGNQPADGAHDKDNEPAGHQPRASLRSRPACSCAGVTGTPGAKMTPRQWRRARRR